MWIFGTQQGKNNKKHQEQEPEPKFIVNFYFQKKFPRDGELRGCSNIRAGDARPASSSLSGRYLEKKGRSGQILIILIGLFLNGVIIMSFVWIFTSNGLIK